MTTPPYGFAVVRGESMLPWLRPGDRLLLSYRRTPRPGDVVLTRLPDGVLAVKRVGGRRPGGWWLLSDNPARGVDSRHHGPFRADDVLAVARARVWPWPATLRRRPPRRT